ncbi:hypothetical protein FKR81_42705 [Lentzea tibetensis]|uniref:Uncharacterized protein n=1 Tax=Lentzea tibetensis TaxID=2591470 RepID=A0A563EEE2_9PSEU|nr:hypothetical protein FKR81_42705 [Lentzea tibetensis]
MAKPLVAELSTKIVLPDPGLHVLFYVHRPVHRARVHRLPRPHGTPRRPASGAPEQGRSRLVGGQRRRCRATPDARLQRCSNSTSPGMGRLSRCSAFPRRSSAAFCSGDLSSSIRSRPCWPRRA